MTRAMFSELVTINCVPLRWQNVLPKITYYRKCYSYDFHSSIHLTTPERSTYHNKIFFEKIFNTNALDFCHSLLSLVLDRNVDGEPTCTWGPQSSRIGLVIGVRCH